MRHAVSIVLLSLAGVTACTQLPQHPPVPPIPAERVLAPPPSRTALIWRPGHYDWDGAVYSWRPGAWVERAGHGTLWQDGYWSEGPNGSAWVPGHWM